MSRISYGAVLVSLGLAVGCSTTGKDKQFPAVPMARVGAEELGTPTKQSPTALLKAADEAFRRGNAAQEAGDTSTALKQYGRMLELLSEAGLDPAIFEGLREQFANILDSSSESPDLFERPAGEVLAERGAGALFRGSPGNEHVLEQIQQITDRYPKQFQAGLNRSTKYRPFIEEEFRKAGLPEGLVWLAMVESQFHPNVVSRAGAVGMWQFMKSTGKRYGLRVDDYVDERRDWQKSTRAAAQYLKDLYAMFEDWPLAVSSYNMGEGGMSRMVAMNGGDRNLYSLITTPPASHHMHQETKEFYPKFYATYLVATAPTKYGFRVEPQPPDQFVRVPVKGSYSLAALEREAGLPNGTLKALNPELIRGATPSGEHQLAVPAQSRETFLAALDSVYNRARSGAVYASNASGGRTHVVRRGETLAAISKQYGVSVDSLMKANRIKSARHVPVNKRLSIPGRGEDPEIETARGGDVQTPGPAAEAAASMPKTTGQKTYRVKRGDTLYDIARANNVTVAKLQAWNALGKNARIHVGDELIVAGPDRAGAPSGERRIHVVKRGEYPASIAAQHGVPVDLLLEWNKLNRKSILRVGEELVIYGGESKPAGTENAPDLTAGQARVETARAAGAETGAPGPRPERHKVAKGETLSTIAARHGVSVDDLLRWNKLERNSVIHPDDELLLHPPVPGVNDSVQVAVATPAGPPGQATSATGTSMPGDRPEAAGTRRHTVAKGDTLTKIAAVYGADLDSLLARNGLTKDSVLHVGREIVIDGTAAKTEHAPAGGGQKAPMPGAPGPSASTHTVAAGETVSGIAARYKIATKDLLAWNGLEGTSVLRIGQKLTLVQPAASGPGAGTAPGGKQIIHRVAAGENPTMIARRYNVRVEDLFTWNAWEKGHVLHVGDEVVVHVR